MVPSLFEPLKFYSTEHLVHGFDGDLLEEAIYDNNIPSRVGKHALECVRHICYSQMCET